MQPSNRAIRIAAALIFAAGLAASGVAIFPDELGVGAQASPGTLGWRRMSLLLVGGVALAAGALLLARPGVLFKVVDWEQMRPLDHRVRIAGALLAVLGAGASGVAIFAEQLGLGTEEARGEFGWKQISLLSVGAVVAVIGALLWARPRIVSRQVGWQQVRQGWGRIRRGPEGMRRYLRSRLAPSDPERGYLGGLRAALRSWRKPFIASGLATTRFITQHRRLIVGAVLLAAAVISLLAADRRPLWNDEIYTLVIADQPTLRGVWDVLHTGVEQIPPGFHLIERATIELLGDGAVALRLPALLGFLATGIFLYLFVARRLGAPAGIVALLFPFTTAAFFYSYEARPYAIALGLAAATLFCWQSYTIGRRPRAAIVGLALGGAVLVSIHYYAVLALLPIVVGEAIRSGEMRRLDRRVWIALLVAVAPLLAFIPLMRAAADFATTFWTELFFDWDSGIEFYRLMIDDRTLALAALIGVAVAIVAIRRALRARSDRPVATAPPSPRLPRHELGAALTYLALPVLVTVIALVATDAYTDRYVLPAIVGAAILFAAGVAFLDRRRGIVLAPVCVILALLAADSIVASYRATAAERDRQERQLRILEDHAPPRGDIVLSDPHAFLELTHAAPPSLAQRLVYLADPDAALRTVETDSIDAGLVGLAPFGDLDVRPYTAYLSRHQRFVVLTGRSRWDWLIPDLHARARAIRIRAEDAGMNLLEVSVPGQVSPVAGSRERTARASRSSVGKSAGASQRHRCRLLAGEPLARRDFPSSRFCGRSGDP